MQERESGVEPSEVLVLQPLLGCMPAGPEHSLGPQGRANALLHFWPCSCWACKAPSSLARG